MQEVARYASAGWIPVSIEASGPQADPDDPMQILITLVRDKEGSR
jgi:hypothetical protein